MITQAERLRGWIAILSLLVVAACVPAVAPEPEAAAYPPPRAATATPLPYPWPTRPPPPTEEPTSTEEPLPTDPPVPTSLPTPVVTSIPTAAPPIIPLPEGATAGPFSLYWRDGDVILTLRSEGQAEPSVFLDPVKEFGLDLVAREVDNQFRTWGAISPDGRTFALVLTDAPDHPLTDWPYPAHIYLLDRESRELRQLARYGAEPVWSPDGKRLVYRSLETGGLWVAEAVSGKAHEVYEVDRDNEHSISEFTWSHDSRHLAVVDMVIKQSAALILVDVEQSEPPRALIEETPYLLGRSQWSPVADLIAFMWSAGEGGRGSHLWIIDPHDGKREQLTTTIRAMGGYPLWSPDGKWIAFSGPIQYEGESLSYDLWLADPVGLDLKRVTNGDADVPTAPFGVDASMPLWSPDGTQLIFVRVPSQGELAEIWVMSLADGSERRLVEIMSVFDDGLMVGP